MASMASHHHARPRRRRIMSPYVAQPKPKHHSSVCFSKSAVATLVILFFLWNVVYTNHHEHKTDLQADADRRAVNDAFPAKQDSSSLRAKNVTENTKVATSAKDKYKSQYKNRRPLLRHENLGYGHKKPPMKGPNKVSSKNSTIDGNHPGIKLKGSHLSDSSLVEEKETIRKTTLSPQNEFQKEKIVTQLRENNTGLVNDLVSQFGKINKGTKPGILAVSSKSKSSKANNITAESLQLTDRGSATSSTANTTVRHTSSNHTDASAPSPRFNRTILDDVYNATGVSTGRAGENVSKTTGINEFNHAGLTESSERVTTQPVVASRIEKAVKGNASSEIESDSEKGSWFRSVFTESPAKNVSDGSIPMANTNSTNSSQLFAMRTPSVDTGIINHIVANLSESTATEQSIFPLPRKGNSTNFVSEGQNTTSTNATWTLLATESSLAKTDAALENESTLKVKVDVIPPSNKTKSLDITLTREENSPEFSSAKELLLHKSNSLEGSQRANKATIIEMEDRSKGDAILSSIATKKSDSDSLSFSVHAPVQNRNITMHYAAGTTPGNASKVDAPAGFSTNKRGSVGGTSTEATLNVSFPEHGALLTHIARQTVKQADVSSAMHAEKQDLATNAIKQSSAGKSTPVEKSTTKLENASTETVNATERIESPNAEIV